MIVTTDNTAYDTDHFSMTVGFWDIDVVNDDFSDTRVISDLTTDFEIYDLDKSYLR